MCYCVRGLLLISILDFGNPQLVTMGLSIQRPVTGILKLATSLEFGEAEETEEFEESGASGKSNSQVAGEDAV